MERETAKAINGWIGLVAALALSAGFFTAAGIWLMQILRYLRTGAWYDVPTTIALHHIVDWPWLIFPDDWLGIHRALEWLNAGAAALIVGFLVAFAVFAFSLPE